MRGRVSTPIAADESVALRARGAARGRARGLRRRQRQAGRRAAASGRRARRCALARAQGLGAFLSSTLDGPWGIAAALQLAAVRGALAGLRAGDAGAVRLAARARAAGAAERHARGADAARGWASRSPEELLATLRRQLAAELGDQRGDGSRAAGDGRRGRRRRRSAPGRWAPCRRSCALRWRSPRRARPRSPAAAAGASAARARPARARPARRCAAGAPARVGSCARRPARWSSMSCSDWSANSGWRSQIATTSSIGAASIQDASRSSASARAARDGGILDPGRGAHGDQRRRSGPARAARPAAPGGRRASSRPGSRPRPPRRSRPGGPRTQCSRWSSSAVRLVEPLGDGAPRRRGLHEAGDEEDRCVIGAHGAGPSSVSRRGADQPDLRAGSGVRRRAGALRHAPRGHLARARATRRSCSRSPAATRSRRCRCSTSAPPASSRSGWPRRAGARWRSPAPPGTAAANLHPAVIEAREARVPLIVLTADRPPELREVGAGQSIDQLKLYGGAVKWFVEVGTHEPAPRDRRPPPRAGLPRLRDRRRRPARAGAPQLPAARAARARARAAGRAADWAGRADGRALDASCASTRRAAHADDVAAAGRADRRRAARGDRRAAARAEDVAERGRPPGRRARAGRCWPSRPPGVRCGPHDRSHVIAHYDVLLRSRAVRRRHAPGLVLRVGDMPTSKPLRAWLAGAPQVVLDPHAAWHEPTRRAELLVQAAAGADARRAGRGRRDAQPRRDAGLAGGLARRRRARPGALGGDAGRVRAEARSPRSSRELPDGALVWVSSSMPMRDVEAFFPQSPKRLRFLANRGANGIDGVVSSAAGAALATGAPTWLLTGELALLHDVGGLFAARRAPAPTCTSSASTTTAAASSTSCRSPSTPTRPSTRSTSRRRRSPRSWPTS